MSTLARRLDELKIATPDELARVRSTRTRRSDIVELGLLVADELAPPLLPDAYLKAVLDVYRREEISAARALGLLFDTWEDDDLSRSSPGYPLTPLLSVILNVCPALSCRHGNSDLLVRKKLQRVQAI